MVYGRETLNLPIDYLPDELQEKINEFEPVRLTTDAVLIYRK